MKLAVTSVTHSCRRGSMEFYRSAKVRLDGHLDWEEGVNGPWCPECGERFPTHVSLPPAEGDRYDDNMNERA